MKFIGQYIQDFIARFRSDVYLEDISTGTIASGGNLGLDSNNKIVKANEATGDITSITVSDGLGATHTTSSGDHTTQFLTGEGIDVSLNSLSATVKQVTYSAEDASDSNKGIVELATTGEADTGTDTARAVTPAGLKSHVDKRYAYQYLHFYATWSMQATNWTTHGNNGLENHTWGTNLSVSNSTIGDNVSFSRELQVSGYKVPVDCKLVGFYSTGHRFTQNQAFAAGLFVCETPDYGGKTDTSTNQVDAQNASLQAYAEAEQVSSNGYNQKLNKLVDLSRSYDLSAGDIIFPAVRDLSGVSGNSFRWSCTIVFATPLVTF